VGTGSPLITWVCHFHAYPTTTTTTKRSRCTRFITPPRAASWLRGCLRLLLPRLLLPLLRLLQCQS